MTELELAERLHRDLGPLACDAGWATTATDGQTQGHYSDPIADAKESAGVSAALADATAIQLRATRRIALGRCLDRLQLHYAARVDVSNEGYSERLSQIGQAIEQLRQSLVGRVALGANLRGGRRPDYDLNTGTVVSE